MRVAMIVIMSSIAIAFGGVTFAQDDRIKLPSDYRTTFTNYLSMDRLQNHDQVIRMFANDIAMKGMKDGKFEFGSILVAEVYKAKKNKSGKVIESSLGRRVRDKFAVIAVMEKGPGWGAKFDKEHKNGDWDFAAFKPDGTRANKDLNACRACHAPLTEQDHVFSFEHIGK